MHHLGNFSFVSQNILTTQIIHGELIRFETSFVIHWDIDLVTCCLNMQEYI